MRIGVHVDAGVGEMPQCEAQRHVALRLVDGRDPHLRADTQADDGDDSGNDEQRASHRVILPDGTGADQLPARISS